MASGVVADTSTSVSARLAHPTNFRQEVLSRAAARSAGPSATDPDHPSVEDGADRRQDWLGQPTRDGHQRIAPIQLHPGQDDGDQDHKRYKSMTLARNGMTSATRVSEIYITDQDSSEVDVVPCRFIGLTVMGTVGAPTPHHASCDNWSTSSPSARKRLRGPSTPWSLSRVQRVGARVPLPCGFQT